MLYILGKDADPEKLDDERAFYKDQLTFTRKMRIDNFHVDVEHEAQLREADLQRRLEEEMEMDVL